MTTKKMSMACYDCKYVGDVPGSCHKMCTHPSIKENKGAELMSVFASVGRCDPVVDRGAATTLNISAVPQGVEGGWFNWPYNFDPLWLINCDGFKKK